ncbi:MAG TPA: hypothetical protein PLZ12_20750 [Saprospiraceae bacterium]|nr:hypothetical protein [Saprospiraceae bacterium]
MKNSIYILFILCLIGCDPMDDRLIFQNNSSNNIFIKCFFIQNNQMYGTWVGLRPIAQNERKVIGIIGTWETSFRQFNPMEPMYIVVYNNIKEQGMEAKSDSLLRIGDYEFKKYSYQELMSKKWEIVYPDDGFETGIPIDLD